MGMGNGHGHGHGHGLGAWWLTPAGWCPCHMVPSLWLSRSSPSWAGSAGGYNDNDSFDDRSWKYLHHILAILARRALTVEANLGVKMRLGSDFHICSVYSEYLHLSFSSGHFGETLCFSSFWKWFKILHPLTHTNYFIQYRIYNIHTRLKYVAMRYYPNTDRQTQAQ